MVLDNDEECDDAESMQKLRAKYKPPPPPYYPPSQYELVQMSITRICTGFNAAGLDEIVEEDFCGFPTCCVYAHWPVRFVVVDGVREIGDHWADPLYWTAHNFTQEMIDDVLEGTHYDWTLYTESHHPLYAGYRDGQRIPLPPLDSENGWWIKLD